MFRFCLSQPPDKTSSHFRGQLVNPNFAESIEFSTKFSETPLRKLILLTERLSVEIGNLIPFIYLGRMKINSTFIKYFGEKHDFSQITNQKLQIRVTTVLFHISPWFDGFVRKKQQQSWFCLLTESKLLSPDHRCLEGFHQEARKLFQQRKTSRSASIRKFLISASDDKTLHGCWRRCLFMRSVIREDGLDVLFALRASVANVTSTNWTKKGDFRRN